MYETPPDPSPPEGKRKLPSSARKRSRGGTQSGGSLLQGMIRSAKRAIIGVHTCIHTVHTYIHTYISTYVRTYVCMYVHACIGTNLHAFMHRYIHAYIHTYIQAKHLKWGAGRLTARRVPPFSHCNMQASSRTHRNSHCDMQASSRTHRNGPQQVEGSRWHPAGLYGPVSNDRTL